MKPKISHPWHVLLTLGFSLKVRILLGTLIPVVAVGVYFGTSFLTQKQLTDMTHAILNERITMMHAAGQIKQALVSYDDALFRYLAIHDSEQLREGRSQKKTVEEQIRHLEQFSNGSILKERLALLSVESKQYFADAERLLHYAQSSSTQDIGKRSQEWIRGPDDSHLELAFLSQEGRARLIRVFALCDEVVTVNRIALEQAQSDMEDLFARSKTRGLLLSGLSIGVLTLVMAGFALSVLYPMNGLLQGVRRIEQGDLEVQIPVLTNDEVGELSDAFNRATRTIREQREQLWRESVTDHLTGAYNQRHFRKIITQEVERAKRAKTSLALLMVDIDHFKTYNDTHGHEFGNEVIRRVVDLARNTMRQSDLIARYGGDELAILLPETNPEDAQSLTRRLLEEVSRARVPTLGLETKHISVSVGGASFPSDATFVEELVKKADEALYAAKKGGRARAHWAGLPAPIITA